MFQSLRARLLIAVAGLVLLTTMTIMFLVQAKSVNEISSIHEENAKNLLYTVLLSVENEYKSILSQEAVALSIRKSELKNITTVALSSIEMFYRKYKAGTLTEKQARRTAVEEIKRIRYDDGVGYLWINDIRRPVPRMIMHPTIPGLDGKILDDPKFNCAEGVQKNLFTAFVDVCLEKGEGFVDYLWPKPTREGLTAEQPKLSYVTLFEPWNWVIGTGVYIDDIEHYKTERFKAVLTELKLTFDRIKNAQEGYMFLFNGKKEILIHPSLEGADFTRLKNPDTGQLIFEELIVASRNPHIPFAYRWDKPLEHPGQYRFPKKAYVRYFQPLDWYIGSSFYDDDIRRPARLLRNEIFLLSSAFILIALLLSLVLSRNLSNPLRKLAGAAREIEEMGVTSASIPICGTSETRRLGSILDKMLHSIRKTETALRKERDLNKEADTIINLSPAVAFLWENSPGLPVAFVSRNVKELLGYGVEDFTSGRVSYGDVIHPEDLPRAQEESVRFDGLKAAENFSHEPYRVITRDGSVKWVDDRTHLRRDEGGNITHRQSIVLDITARRQALEELKRLRNYLKNIIDSMPSVLVGVDARGNVSQWNREAEKATGISAHEAHSRALGETFPQLAEQMENIRGAIRERKLIKDEKVPRQMGDDTRFFDITIYPLVANGTEGAVIRVDDVTNRVRIEDMMVQTEKMMSVGGLAAGMAHEINNPLGIILQAIQNTRRRISSDFEKNHEAARKCGIKLENLRGYLGERNILHYLDGMQEAGLRAARIVKNMLNFSRRSDSRPQPVDLNKMLDETLELASNDYDLKKKYDFRLVDITRDYDPQLPPVPCVKTEIEQVVLNLLKNAVQAMAGINREGYRPGITVKTRKEDRYARIEVADNGPGMDEKTRKRVFEPFFTTKEVGVGTGLGLSVSYFIITDNHQGKLSVRTVPDGGTVFNIHLPITPAQETARDEGLDEKK